MTKSESEGEVIDLKGLLARDEEFVRAAVEALVRAALEAEMTEAIGVAKGERSEPVVVRSRYYSRSLIYPGWHVGAARAAAPYGAVFE